VQRPNTASSNRSVRRSWAERDLRWRQWRRVRQVSMHRRTLPRRPGWQL